MNISIRITGQQGCGKSTFAHELNKFIQAYYSQGGIEGEVSCASRQPGAVFEQEFAWESISKSVVVIEFETLS